MSDVQCTTDERGVTTLMLDRPEHHNALTRSMIDQVTAALEQVQSQTRVLVVTGRGDSFCAGADVNWMKASATLSEQDNRADAKALSNMLEALDNFPHPSIAVVQGAAVGGGCGILACCDIAIASESARFGFSEVRLGLTPATISPYVLAATGARQARRWFLTGERFDALEAYRMRLVHDLCSTDSLGHRLDKRLADLLAGGPEAQQAIKQLIKDVALRPTTDEIRTDIADRLAKLRTSDEAQEGLSAFLEKRKPSFDVS